MGPKITFTQAEENKMTVKFIKLNNGEEIVATVAAKGEKLELTNPVKFMMTHEGLGMMPFFPLCEDKPVLIDGDLVMLTADLDKDIYNAYAERFGLILRPTTAQTMKIVTGD
jgi:hypothetical protein